MLLANIPKLYAGTQVAGNCGGAAISAGLQALKVPTSFSRLSPKPHAPFDLFDLTFMAGCVEGNVAALTSCAVFWQ